MGRPVAAGGAALHFVDDRFATLHAVAQQAPDLVERWARMGGVGEVGASPGGDAGPRGRGRERQQPPLVVPPALAACSPLTHTSARSP